MNNAPFVPGPTVVSEKAYRFVPPRDSRFWPWILGAWLPGYLRRSHGIESWEIEGRGRMEASLKAGHGIMLAPNHPRPSDPMALGLIVRAFRQPLNVMASAHLFLQNRLYAWLLPRIGAFSVYREGMDRESLKTAIDILANARRPLVIFAEGVITRTNDRLIDLQDGVTFMARSAAKQRAGAAVPGKVVLHPLALRYTFKGDLEKTLNPILEKLELRLAWQPQRHKPLTDRVVKLGHALLALKELEYFGAARHGPVPERISRLLDGVLAPLETEWLRAKGADTVVNRVKTLRKVILPGLVAGEVSDDERARRWKQLYDLEVAGQIYHFPPDYLGTDPTPERLMETVERYEEAMDPGNMTVIRPLHLRFEIGEAIPVEPQRDKRASSDPVMDSLRASLTSMLGLPANGNHP